MIYKFAEGFRLKNDAQVIGEHLAILEKLNGELNPQVLVNDAKNEASPIHNEFEWNDAVAADGYRQEQAKYLLRAVVTVVQTPDGESKQVRAFVNVKIGDGYTSIARVFESPDLTAQLLSKALKDLLAVKKRYQIYSELGGLCKDIDQIIFTWKPPDEQAGSVAAN